MEQWRPVIGYEGFYLVSNLGRIMNRHGEIIVPSNNSAGYARVILTKIKSRKSFKVSRLVAIAFIENSENKPEVNHKSGIKSDNSVDNLEWSTHSENIQHAYDTGLKVAPTNEDHPMCKFSNEVVAYIRSHCAMGASRREMQELFGISKRQVGRIIKGTSRTGGIWQE